MTINKTIIFVVILIICCYSCRPIKPCGIFNPIHQIVFVNDSIFEYTKWKLPIDTSDNSIGLFSNGKYVKISKNSYRLNSYFFNPDSIKTENTEAYDPKLNGLKLNIFTDIFDSDFKFNKCKLIVNIDNQIYNFVKNIDTTIQQTNIKTIKITLDISSNKNYPPIIIDHFNIIPIQGLNANINKINIHFPITEKYFHWYKINNAVLKKYKKGKFRINDDSWIVSLKNKK